MSKENMKRLRLDGLLDVEPKTAAQEKAFQAWKKGQNLVLDGAAGTGKTFIAMAMGLEQVLDPSSHYKRLIIIRSIVPTRQIGYLPGTEEEKIQVYARPYEAIASELFSDKLAWKKLETHENINFECTSFIRGETWNNAIVLVDEMQNCNYHELDSIITRLGDDSRIIFSGDYYQSDFTRESEKNGLLKFISLIKSMSQFTHIEFEWKDIVRSRLVREYIITKEKARREGEIPVNW